MKEMYRAGVDLGGTFIKFGIFNQHKELCKKWQTVTPKGSAENLMKTISDEISNFFKAEGLDESLLIGVGMGVPASITPEGRILDAPNIGLHDENIVEIWNQLRQIPLYVENDANAAGLGEFFHGSKVKYKSMIFVTLGTGVGASVIQDGKLIKGSHSGAGELGHMTMNPSETTVCNCGKYGCLEQYASANGLVRVTSSLVQNTNIPSMFRSQTEYTSKDVFEGLKKGDQIAVRAVEIAGETLGRALSLAAATIDPDVFILGGGMSKAGVPLLQLVQKYYKKYAFFPFRNTIIELSTLGNDAGIYGAMELIPEEIGC